VFTKRFCVEGGSVQGLNEERDSTSDWYARKRQVTLASGNESGANCVFKGGKGLSLTSSCTEETWKSDSATVSGPVRHGKEGGKRNPGLARRAALYYLHGGKKARLGRPRPDFILQTSNTSSCRGAREERMQGTILLERNGSGLGGRRRRTFAKKKRETTPRRATSLRATATAQGK